MNLNSSTSDRKTGEMKPIPFVREGDLARIRITEEIEENLVIATHPDGKVDSYEYISEWSVSISLSFLYNMSFSFVSIF